MGMHDRRFLAALFFCLLALASCGGERAAVEHSPAVLNVPPREEPAPETPSLPAQPPVEEQRQVAPLEEAPSVRVLVLGVQQAIRVRALSTFNAGSGTAGEPVATIERGGDFTIKAVGREAVLASGKKRLISSSTVFIMPRKGEFIFVGGKPYRGIMLFRAADRGVMAINILDIDDYIKGVLPSEIGHLKPGQFEAYRAQAIAARSYALSKLEEKTADIYDLNATVMDQVYSGAGGESEAASRAVDETRGLVCTFLGEPIKAYYCSCCGGHTADIRTVWPWKTPYPYLYGVRDTVRETSGESLCRASRHFRWRVHWSASTLAGILRKTVPRGLKVPGRGVGKLADIRVIGTGPDGRVLGIEIVTDRESFEVLGDRIRWVMKPDPASDAILRSTLFKLDVSISGGRIAAIDMLGGGNGHGVGMCQTGAIRMAEIGYSGEEIIRHYYPGSTIEPRYR
jgi:stage II sporulation protein D